MDPLPPPVPEIFRAGYIKEFLRHYKAERNDPCPCRSGKKFKKCCIKYTEK